MRAVLVLVALAAVMLFAGCHTSGSVGIGDKSANIQQPAQQQTTNP